MLDRLRKQLMKIKWLKREVMAYQAEKKEQARHERWAAQLMDSSYAIRRNVRPFNLNVGDAEPVTAKKSQDKPYIDSTNWGGTKI